MGSFSQGTVRQKSESLARAAYPLLSPPSTEAQPGVHGHLVVHAMGSQI